MDSTTSTILTVSIPAIISILGFIVTYMSMKKSFQHELRQQKVNIQLEKMSVVPYEVLKFMQDLIDSGKNGRKISEAEIIRRMNELYTTIFAYGSPAAIAILSSMQSENYINATIPQNQNKYRMMCYYILLAVQIRFDITGQIITADKWFKMRLTDYDSNRNEISQANNKLVEELSLSKEFLIN